VGAVVLKDGAVLLVRRRRPPLAGAWSLPGGLVELGERLEDALVREVREETGLRVEPRRLVALVDYIEPDAGGQIAYHFVIADYLCRYIGGRPRAGSDAGEVRLVPLSALAECELPPRAVEVIRSAARAQRAGRRTRSQKAGSSWPSRQAEKPRKR
jgi:mutator protein MutT